MYWLKVIGCFLLFCNVGYAQATALAQLKTFLRASQTLSASFRQSTLGENGTILQNSYGLFYLQKPAKFRWSYQKPFAQEIIAKDDKVYFYDIELEQISIKNMDTNLAPIMDLLSRNIVLADDFVVQQLVDTKQIKLTPQNINSGVNYLIITMADNVISQIQIIDNFGQSNRISFTDIKINDAIDKDIFEFTVPDGVDVFTQ